LPNAKTSARQRRTAAIPLVLCAGGTWNGCNPNTVMRINWRASLVPAAAVIPAPRAYTNIAAVKTPVVCHRVVGLLSGLGPGSFGGGTLLRGGTPPASPGPGVKPSVVCSHAQSKQRCECPCPEAPSLGSEVATLPTPVRTIQRGRSLRAPERPRVHHRGPPLSTPWKTQCAQGDLCEKKVRWRQWDEWLNVSPWNGDLST